MDWLLGRRPQQNQPPQQPAQQQQLHSQQPIYEAPDIDDLLVPHDPARLHPLANLDKDTLDYIILEDEQIKSAGALPSRGWTDDLCYGTGAVYLTGLGMGGAYGLAEGLRKTTDSTSSRLRLNGLCRCDPARTIRYPMEPTIPHGCTGVIARTE